MTTEQSIAALIQKAADAKLAELKEEHRKQLKRERAKITSARAQRDEYRARARELQANMYRYQKELAEAQTALRKSV